jgi:hypothetical protein
MRLLSLSPQVLKTIHQMGTAEVLNVGRETATNLRSAKRGAISFLTVDL